MITKGIWYILGNGIELEDEEFSILPYLKIRKIHQLSVFDLAKLGVNGFSQWSLIEPFCYKKNNFEIISYSGDMHPPKKQICLYFMT